jgi:iron complex outermembrane receptor protein
MQKQTYLAQAALALCALAAGLRAESAPTAAPSTNIPPVVVQASRAGRTAAEMPANVQVITAEEIARGGQPTVLDVLQKQAGLPVKNFSDNPTTAFVALRGFGETGHGRVLVLVNNERLNNPDMSAPNLMRIPVASVKRIEVIRGPQTVLYGDFAEAGVINIITDTSVEVKPATTVSASAGSYDTYAAHVSKSGAFDDGVTYFAGADWNKTGGYRDNGDYESWNLDASLAKAWKGGQSLSLSAFYHDSEYGLPGALSWKQFQNDPRQTLSPDDRAWFDTWGLSLAGGAPVGDNGKLDANLTASRRETDFRYLGAMYTSYRASEIDTVAFSPRYSNDGAIAGHDNLLTLGGDLRYDASTIDSHGKSYGFPYDYVWDFDRTTLAAYAKDEFFLTETLSVAVGARAERFYNRIANDRDTTSESDVERAFDAALLYRPAEAVKLFARVARYYHAPFIDETVGWTGTPNTDLVPETGYDFEAGAEATLAKEWTAGLTVYDLETSDEIYYNPTTYMNVNAPDDTRRQGAEAKLRWSRDRVGLVDVAYDCASASFTDGAYDGKHVPLVPEHMVTLNGEAYIVSQLCALGTVRYVSSQYSGSDFSNDTEKLRDYGTLDLALRYEPAQLKGFKLLAGVDNVLDREYAYCSFYGSSYYPASGRTWKLSASYTF